MRIVSLVVALLAIVAGFSPALAKTVIVPAGTHVYATSNNTISSKSSYEGESFSLTVHEPYTIAGGKLWARVVKARKAGQGTKPELSIVVDKISFPNGSSSIIYANLDSVSENQKSNVGTVALTALGGMIAGNIIGKWLGTNAGGAVGLTAGVLYGINSKTDVTIPTGADAKFQLTRALTVNR